MAAGSEQCNGAINQLVVSGSAAVAAAIVPFAAYRHYGNSFKWMLYGDDDTLWYMPGGRAWRRCCGMTAAPAGFVAWLWLIACALLGMG